MATLAETLRDGIQEIDAGRFEVPDVPVGSATLKDRFRDRRVDRLVAAVTEIDQLTKAKTAKCDRTPENQNIATAAHRAARLRANRSTPNAAHTSSRLQP